LVIVHGETIVEPVEPGTNLAAITCPDVDLLAHPGLLRLGEAKLAAANGIFLEITARKGHSLTNGLIAKLALQSGAKLLLNSDAHDEADLLTTPLARAIAQGAGLAKGQIQEILISHPRLLLEKLGN
jgi:histidinol phosphatase-like PHP family hydrolase